MMLSGESKGFYGIERLSSPVTWEAEAGHFKFEANLGKEVVRTFLKNKMKTNSLWSWLE
jgi:hypothetical protein